MATKYSDYIKMQDFLPVYDMTAETPEMWRTFIPTKQFCNLLQRSVTAFTSSEISIWTSDVDTVCKHVSNEQVAMNMTV